MCQLSFLHLKGVCFCAVVLSHRSGENIKQNRTGRLTVSLSFALSLSDTDIFMRLQTDFINVSIWGPMNDDRQWYRGSNGQWRQKPVLMRFFFFFGVWLLWNNQKTLFSLSLNHSLSFLFLQYLGVKNMTVHVLFLCLVAQERAKQIWNL